MNGPFADALSDLAGRSLALVEREDGAWATDSRPATLVSEASLALIDGDGRRFRMLLELDGLEALEEERWRDRRVRIGEVAAPRRRGDAPLRRPVGEPGHGRPRSRCPPRAGRETRTGCR